MERKPKTDTIKPYTRKDTRKYKEKGRYKQKIDKKIETVMKRKFIAFVSNWGLNLFAILGIYQFCFYRLLFVANKNNIII